MKCFLNNTSTAVGSFIVRPCCVLPRWAKSTGVVPVHSRHCCGQDNLYCVSCFRIYCAFITVSQTDGNECLRQSGSSWFCSGPFLGCQTLIVRLPGYIVDCVQRTSVLFCPSRAVRARRCCISFGQPAAAQVRICLLARRHSLVPPVPGLPTLYRK